MRPKLRIVRGLPPTPPDMSPDPQPVGGIVGRHAYCAGCKAWTRQIRRILQAVAGIREASTDWYCTGHKGWAR